MKLVFLIIFWSLGPFVLFKTYITFQNYNSAGQNQQQGGFAFLYFIYVFLKHLTYCYGMFFYFYLFFSGAFTFWLYKWQTEVFYLIPSWGNSNDFSNYYVRFYVFWSVGAGLLLINTFMVLGEQITVDVFFIDWERPTTFAVNKSGAAGGFRKKKKAVSIWRTLLVCNEFNELSVERYISRPYTFLISAFLLM